MKKKINMIDVEFGDKESTKVHDEYFPIVKFWRNANFNRKGEDRNKVVEELDDIHTYCGVSNASLIRVTLSGLKIIENNRRK